MLINDTINTEHVKFVNYTGAYPNLCSGVLTLNIDGEDYFFGIDHDDYSQKHGYKNFNEYVSNYEKDGPHFVDKFWSSGGSAYFDNEWNDYVCSGEWKIDVDDIPEQFKTYATEINSVFNANVPYGCCGGCL